MDYEMYAARRRQREEYAARYQAEQHREAERQRHRAWWTETYTGRAIIYAVILITGFWPLRVWHHAAAWIAEGI